MKQEWKKILKNPWMVIILIAIVTIPAIYTSVFLGSMWDPYGDADKLPVAVVNRDKKVDYEGKTLEIGDELVKNLKESKALDFHFVSEEKARSGLKNGKYYMIISIPENFSKNATTLMDKNPKQMKLTYRTNPGTNYVASKMDDSAMAKIEKTVSEEVTKTYAETVFAQVKDAGSGFGKAADGAGKLENGTKELKEGNDKIEKNLKKLASSSLTFQNGAKTLSVGLKSYTDGVAEVNSGASDLKSGAKTLASGTKTLASGASDLKSGVKSLKDGTNALESGAKQLQTGSSSLKIGIAGYTAGVDQAKAGSEALKSNNKALNQGVKTLSEGSKELKSGSQSLTAGIDGVLSAAKTTSSQLGTVMPQNSEIQNLTNGMDQLNSGIQALNQYLQGTVTSSQTRTTTTTTENEAGKRAAESVSKAKTHVSTMQEKLAELKNSSVLNKLSEEEKQQLLAEIGEVESAASAVENDVDTVYSDAKEASKTTVKTTQTSTSKASAQDTLKEVKGQVEKLASSSEQILPKGKTAVSQMYGGLQAVKTGLDQKGTTQDTMGMIQALETLKGGASKVQDGMTSLESGINHTQSGLSIGIKNYTAGVESLDSGLTKISANSKSLNAGASQLNSGITQIEAKLPQFTAGTSQLYSGAGQLAAGSKKLDDGAGQLYSGTKTLKTGTETLVANSNTLNAGAVQLADGAGQIANGSGQLAAGSVTLGNGISTLQDGSKTLKDSLQKGADQVNSIQATDKTNRMFAAPVKAENVEDSHVQNNGHAMAPYMMSVGLFVACMAFTLMYPLMEKSEEVKSGLQWWLSKVTVMAVVSVVQAVIMVGVLITVNGLEPNYVGKTFGMAVLASMAFMALICFGEMLLNRIGSFVMLVFMVIQLGAAGGTYPLDMAPHFYTVLHKYMPFSYTVDAFRHTLSMDGNIGKDVAVFAGILVVSTLATILFYRVRLKKRIGGTLETGKQAVAQH